VAVDQKTMLQAVYDAIFDALTTTPSGIGGGAPILPRSTSHMSLIIPGNPIDPSQFANPWSPQNPNGSMPSAENFALFTDPAPVMSPVFVPGPSTDEMYGEIVHANVSPPPPDPEGQAAFDRAERILFVDGTDFDEEGRPVTVRVPSPFFRNYQNKFKAYSDALTSYLTAYLQYDLSNPQDQRKWAVLGPVLQGPVDLAWGQLQAARPGVIEAALATMGQFQQSSRASIFSRARQAYESTRKASSASPGLFWHYSQAFPANWFADSAADSFTQITINSQRLRISEDSRFSRYGAGGGVNFGLWRVGGGASHESSQYNLSTETHNLEVSFRFARVEVRSPWLKDNLMSLDGWSVAGRAPGAYSDGTATTNAGVFPLLRSSFIVARDLKIRANWGSSDLSIASKATSASASVGWGPFSVSGSYSNSSSSKKFKSDFDGTTLSVNALNIIAVMSKINPFAGPKNGPPALPRVAAPGWRRPRGTQYNPYVAAYAPAEELPLEELLEVGTGMDNGVAVDVELLTGNGSAVEDGAAVEAAAAAGEVLAGASGNGPPEQPSEGNAAHESELPASVFVSAES
jgi:hypothetical protein